jgi:hypothetical protein
MADDQLLFMVIWFLLVLIYFSLTPSKQLNHIVYGYTPLFVIMARSVDELKHPFSLFLVPLVFMLLLFFIPETLLYSLASINNEYTRIIITEGLDYLDSSYRIILGTIIILLAVLPFTRPVPLTVKSGVLGLLFIAITNFLIMPTIGKIKQQPIKTAAQIAQREGFKVTTWKINSPAFNVYFGELTEDRLPVSDEAVLTKTNYLDEIGEHEVIFQRHGIVLARRIIDHKMIK